MGHHRRCVSRLRQRRPQPPHDRRPRCGPDLRSSNAGGVGRSRTEKRAVARWRRPNGNSYADRWTPTRAAGAEKRYRGCFPVDPKGKNPDTQYRLISRENAYAKQEDRDDIKSRSRRKREESANRATSERVISADRGSRSRPLPQGDQHSNNGQPWDNRRRWRDHMYLGVGTVALAAWLPHATRLAEKPRNRACEAATRAGGDVSGSR